jgi:hypothetical protein
MSGLRSKEAEICQIRPHSTVPGLLRAGYPGRPSFLWLVPGVVSEVPRDSDYADVPDVWELLNQPCDRG